MPHIGRSLHVPAPAYDPLLLFNMAVDLVWRAAPVDGRFAGSRKRRVRAMHPLGSLELSSCCFEA